MTGDSANGRALTLDDAEELSLMHRIAPHMNSFTLVAAPINHAGAPASATILNGRQVLERADTAADGCDLKRSSLRSDLTDLAVVLPPILLLQMSWEDSTASDVCVAGVRGSVRTERRFSVIGDTATAEGTAVVISRTDSATLSAEGVVEQHATSIAGGATTAARLYVLNSSGQIWRISKRQLAKLSITAENHTRAFLQKTTSTTELAR